MKTPKLIFPVSSSIDFHLADNSDHVGCSIRAEAATKLNSEVLEKMIFNSPFWSIQVHEVTGNAAQRKNNFPKWSKLIVTNVPNLNLPRKTNRATFQPLAAICEAVTCTYRIWGILEVLGLEIDHFEIPGQKEIHLENRWDWSWGSLNLWTINVCIYHGHPNPTGGPGNVAGTPRMALKILCFFFSTV